MTDVAATREMVTLPGMTPAPPIVHLTAIRQRAVMTALSGPPITADMAVTTFRASTMTPGATSTGDDMLRSPTSPKTTPKTMLLAQKRPLSRSPTIKENTTARVITEALSIIEIMEVYIF